MVNNMGIERSRLWYIEFNKKIEQNLHEGKVSPQAKEDILDAKAKVKSGGGSLNYYDALIYSKSMHSVDYADEIAKEIDKKFAPNKQNVRETAKLKAMQKVVLRNI